MSKHAFIGASFLVASCATPLQSLAADAPGQAPDVMAVERTQLWKITAETLAHDYFAERQYRSPNVKQPKIGLALSGGGTKAGMFAHGILHGLHDADVLAHVDAISSVSGGGYAALWYVSKYLESARTRSFDVSNIFDDCLPSYWTKDDTNKYLKAAMQAAVERPPTPSMPECDNAAHFRAKGTDGVDDPYRWQAHLARWPDLLQLKPVHLTGGKQFSPEKEIRKAAISAVTSEVLKSPGGTKSAVPLLYQYGIERTWALNPKSRDPLLVAANTPRDERLNWNYTNLGPAAPDTGRHLVERTDPATLQWAQLRKLYGPLPAAETPPLWIANATDGNKTRGVNTSKIFEMTPFGYGSANPEHPGYFDPAQAPQPPIADLGSSVRASAGFADAQGVANRLLQKSIRLFAQLIPALEWGVDLTMPTQQGKNVKIRLSDGGGSENLGLYSLLKRGLDDIIIVDSAQDVEGSMSDLCDVRRALRSENVVLEFPALDNLKGVCAGQPSTPHGLAYNVSDWKNPIVKGTATWLDGGGKPARVARIWLVKAAWDERKVAAAYTDPKLCGSEPGQVNCLLAVFYGHNRGVKRDSDNYMLFPQLSTVSTTANSSSYLFWGYRELGRMLGANLRVNDAGSLELRDDQQCRQEALKRLKHRRPEVMKFNKPTPCLNVAVAPGS